MAQGDIIGRASVASLVRTSPVRPTGSVGRALRAAFGSGDYCEQHNAHPAHCANNHKKEA